jgi:hypothetical protein
MSKLKNFFATIAASLVNTRVLGKLRARNEADFILSVIFSFNVTRPVRAAARALQTRDDKAAKLLAAEVKREVRRELRRANNRGTIGGYHGSLVTALRKIHANLVITRLELSNDRITDEEKSACSNNLANLENKLDLLTPQHFKTLGII